jgi:putative flippase GtrA
MILSFFLNLIYNFKLKDKKVVRFSKFFIVNVFGLFFSNIFLFLLSYYIHAIEGAKIISIVIVATIQFLANYFWTFKKI